MLSMSLLDSVPVLGSSGIVGSLSKVASVFAIVVGAWALFVLRMPPGHAGVLVSWNKPLSTKKHKRDECVKNCNHHKATRLARVWVKTNRPKPRDWKRKLVRYRKCMNGCKCEHEIARIIWPQITPKLPWRKAHQIPLKLRTDKLDPIPVDIEDAETGRLSQRIFHCVVDWVVCDNRTTDAPYRADHEINVMDLTKTVVEEITTSTRYTEINHRITRMSQMPGPPDGVRQRGQNARDLNNRQYIRTLVKRDCQKKLFEKYGAIIVDFRFGDNARTPQQVLADALVGSSGSTDTNAKAAVVADQLLEVPEVSGIEQPDEPEAPEQPPLFRLPGMPEPPK